jgi:hypothetical protein
LSLRGPFEKALAIVADPLTGKGSLSQLWGGVVPVQDRLTRTRQKYIVHEVLILVK